MKPVIAGIGEVLWDELPRGRRCGGAPANVVFHAAQLGAEAYVVSAVGNDRDGDDIVAFLEGRGIDCSLIQRNALPTGTVGVTLADGIPSYEIRKPVAWDALSSPPALEALLPRLSAVVFGTLAQRDERSRRTMLRLLRDPSLKALKLFDINIRQDFYSREVIEESLRVADVLKLNAEECELLSGMLDIAGGAEKTVRALIARYGLRSVILTLGAEGSAFCDGGAFARYPVAPCEKLVDTVGCGDAFLAAWCCETLAGGSPESAMRKATLLSAQVAGREGAM